MKKALSRFVLIYLRFLARIALVVHKPKIIGIAGTAGKSSTRNALEAVLQDHFVIKTVHGNSETGIPLGILGIEINGYGILSWLSMLIRAPFGLLYLGGTQYLIAEMGIDEPDPPKNMEYLLSILKPEIAIYLNEGSVHTMQFEKLARGKTFKSEQEKINFLVSKLAEEDAKIITQSRCRIGIYNNDDKFVKKALQSFSSLQTQLLSFGNSKQNDAFYKSYSVDLSGSRFVIQVGSVQYFLHFKNFILPKTYQENFAAVILVAKELGLSPEKIEASLEKNFSLPPGRSSLLDGIRDSIIIDSSYNASKIAIMSFLELMKDLKKETKRPMVFLFGDMREIGSGESFEHKEVAKSIKGLFDYVYCVGELTRKFAMPVIDRDATVKGFMWFNNSQKLGMYLQKNLPPKSIVLVKGSQNTIFLEESIKEILKKKSDAKKLCRQESYWIKLKIKYFSSH
jgi:UDP-N-acetylmuramyl pentapeptide synthase